jgi:hypothetical protein
MWTGNLSTNQSATIILPSINTRGQGDKELQFQLVGPSIIIDGDDYNNFAVTRFNVRGKTSLPYFEDFEYMSLSENGYHVENPDGEITWRNAETGGLIGNTSAQMPCFSYSPRANQTDDLLSPIFDFPSTNKLSLIFNYAYQLKISSFADTLKVYIVDNCDLSQKTLIYAKGGADLETFDSANVNFVPAIASHWSNDTIDLSPYAGMQNIMLDFQSVNRNGNNIYLDNIRVFEGNTAPSSIWESTKANVKIYPNPTSDMVYIESEERGNTPIQITIFDAFGKAIKQMNYTTEPNIRKQISLQNYAPGLYFIQYSSITQTTSFKVVKK